MRLLLVSSRYPLPAWRGNQVRTVEWMRALADHELMLFCPGPATLADPSLGSETRIYQIGPGTRILGVARAALDGRPIQEGFYTTTNARGALQKALRECSPDVVVVQMVRCGWAAEVVRDENPSIPIVFDAIDSMGLHFDRAAGSALQPLAAFFESESRRCRRREAELSALADWSVAVSDRDLEWFAAENDRRRAIPVAGKVAEAPSEPVRDPVVVLTGNLGYRPTVRGAMWFATSVWPRIRSKVPGAKWILSGARPAADIRRLARRPGVEVHANVPDLAPVLASARLAIAPMNSGSGVPMKVLEAMAACIPTVVHPWAADGLVFDGRVGVEVADDADEWVETITRLLADDQEADALAQRGHAVWQRFYHPDRVAEQIREVIVTAAEPVRSTGD